MARVGDPRVLAAAFGLVLLLAIWTTTWIVITSAVEAAEAKAAASARELAQTYEAHALRALREIDYSLRTVKYAYDSVGATNALEELDQRGLLPPELLFEVNIADARGRIVASTRPKTSHDVFDQDFFRASQSRDEFFIAAPRRGTLPNEWKLLFSRRLESRNGEFAGVVFIEADAAFFVSSYDAVVFGNQGLLALVGADHIVRVRRVGDEVSSGAMLDWQRIAAYGSGGNLEGMPLRDEVDDIERFVSTRPLGGLPVAVIVGLARDEQLAAVAAERGRNLLAASLASILLVCVVAMLGRMSWKLALIHQREQQMRLSAARESGMAEIATNVLHNVGNALNSANVSAALVAERLEKSKLAGFARAVTLMREQQDRLGDFLSQDARGKQLPAYLYQLKDAMQADQAASLAQLTALRESVEHIKTIVMMQQTLAKPSALAEEVDVVELIEAGLQMNVDALGRHQVSVVRDFEPAPAVHVDKHTLLQVLVNLISNAKHACSESGREDRLITLRVRTRSDAVELTVADNGVGIPAENLTRIFRHGFTTRARGHGFGLHSSALAAQELGGSLHAHSDGIGCGATFTLTIPLEQRQAAA